MRVDRQFLHPVVAVPVRNEEGRLPRLLAALAAQDHLDKAGERLRTVLVLNGCTDGSRQAALAAARINPALDLDLIETAAPETISHVGSARRLGMERALAGSACPPAATVILTTDADAVPARDWVSMNLAAIAAGADLVGGHIVGDAEEEALLGPGFAARAAAIARYAALADRLAALVDPLPHDPWPRHRDHTGGSLAVRGDVYAAVGGMPALPVREDLAFVSRVRAAGGLLVHPASVRVTVSARLVGRAPGGMADCLTGWMRDEAEGRPVLVEAPDAIEARLLRRRLLRDLDGCGAEARRQVARRLGLDEAALAGSAAALIERFAPDEPDAPAGVPVAPATARLAALIASREAESRAA
ncbi:glycosyltransferase [Antarcticirhabdus aurantiaca]|uniref:Glycosyltransferase family 2 protein n=1 Tax=Antarcticirhabdus aurantiaca TaxID=2606717 RepID=A0ACD4NMG5_9HYPH|nr:glycosyltransferase family A protein [Antarcticirhabdus aurantiaca]WAJ27999.1 glycosyltransferase family 2 protein [Jeongeuplla avenae]